MVCFGFAVVVSQVVPAEAGCRGVLPFLPCWLALAPVYLSCADRLLGNRARQTCWGSCGDRAWLGPDLFLKCLPAYW
jgi:hypothetical protein